MTNLNPARNHVTKKESFALTSVDAVNPRQARRHGRRVNRRHPRQGAVGGEPVPRRDQAVLLLATAVGGERAACGRNTAQSEVNHNTI